MRLCALTTAAFLLTAWRAAGQGTPIGPEFRVNTYTTSAQANPGVSFDGAGNFVVVWHSLGQDGDNYGIFGQRYSSTGAPLSSEFRVNTYTTSGQIRPAVASDAAGNFVVVWQSFQDGSTYEVVGQRYSNAGAPLGGEFMVNTYTTNYQGYADVASDAAGNFVVVWESGFQDGDNRGIFGQRYSSAGGPLGGEFQINTYTTFQQSFSSVASDASGNFVVVWSGDRQDGSQFGIFGKRYSSTGAPLGGEFKVNTYTTNNQLFPHLSSDTSGAFVVVWQSFAQDGSLYGAFGQRYSSTGAPLGGEFRVNTQTTSVQGNPVVALDAAGNFVVAWISLQDGDTYGIFGQRYSSTGASLGGEFRVNTYTTDRQALPAVASDAAGNFVVVWNSMGQDGYGYGVFSQRYAKITPVDLIRFSAE